MKKSVFSTFVCDNVIMLESLQHHGNLQWILPQKILWSAFFPKKKKFRQTSQNGRFPILRKNLKPLSGMEIFFFLNLTYSYSSLAWNLPRINMSSESLHNYFGITVKRRKNYEKFGFLDFCLWSRHNIGIIATLR